ncbi:MAG: hypothetical protein IJO14_08275 [Clostridia bacterium]|nr:hypothetical protein [Clostridia bacterium]
MNDCSALFLCVDDGQTVTLEKDKIYHVSPEDSYIKTGFFCSNTAKYDENPTGVRYCAIFLQNKHDITIDGNGATILIHGKMTPFLLDHCENITIRNLTVDYACPTMTEFTVLSNDNGVCEIRIHPDCRFRVQGNELYWCGEEDANGNPRWENRSNAPKRYVKVLDPVTQTCRDFRRDDLTFEHIEQLDEHTLRVTLADRDADFVPGCVFQTRNIVRDQVGGLSQHCKNIVFENMRICFMHGLGMVSQFCDTVTFRNCDMTPKKGRSVASTADFFQFSGCSGRLLVENCKAYGAQDDYINVHGTHLRIVKTDGGNDRITVRFMHAETWGLQAFEAGDCIEFIKWDTLQPYAQAKVLSFVRKDDFEIELQLDTALPDGIEIDKDVVENATRTPDLYVRNCDFGVTAGRGVLCTTRGEVIIENNRFYHLWGPALLVEDDCNFWFESGYTRHIVFRNNEVIGCEYANTYKDAPVIRFSPKVMDENSTAFVHGKLTCTGNVFRKAWTGKHTIRLEYVESADVYGNDCDAPLQISSFRSGVCNTDDACAVHVDA